MLSPQEDYKNGDWRTPYDHMHTLQFHLCMQDLGLIRSAMQLQGLPGIV